MSILLNLLLIKMHLVKRTRYNAVRWVQQACKCAAADFEKTAKNRFDAFLIRVHIQNHFCWCCVTEYACVILLCRFRFRSYKNLGNITDKLTIILVTRLLH